MRCPCGAGRVDPRSPALGPLYGCGARVPWPSEPGAGPVVSLGLMTHVSHCSIMVRFVFCSRFVSLCSRAVRLKVERSPACRHWGEVPGLPTRDCGRGGPRAPGVPSSSSRLCGQVP